jgi:hypothetical protein
MDQRKNYGIPGVADRVPTHKVPHQESLQDTLKLFDKMSPDDRDKVMLQLLLTGYDTRQSNKVRWGSADPTSRKAYGKAVQTALSTSQSLQDVLNAVQPTPENLDSVLSKPKGSKASKPATNVIQHDNPVDIEASVRSGFQAALGHGPTPEQLKAFLSGWHNNETTLGSIDTSAGGTFNVTALGNAEEMAKSAATKADPAQAQGYNRLKAFKVMLGALGAQ